MDQRLQEGTVLWEPSEKRINESNIKAYLRWLSSERGLVFNSYNSLWRWSVRDMEGFWASIWEYFNIRASKNYSVVLENRLMPGAKWFPGAELNYAENIFTKRKRGKCAIIAKSEATSIRKITWDELFKSVASTAKGLKSSGIKKGDRIAAYTANVPEAITAFLACASIGAIWSSSSPDFGVQSTVDRFSQIEPKILFATDGYMYNGKRINKIPEISEIQEKIPSIEKVVVVPFLSEKPDTSQLRDPVLWNDFLKDSNEIRFEHVPFEHPLWVLYSSGTTGLPKPIVQSQGGILLEHLKALSLHVDINENDTFFWFTSTGWMMWNFLVSGLLLGSTIALYDGNPGNPDMNALWRYAEEIEMSYFGASAAYIAACIKAGINPGRDFRLEKIRGVGSTGSPLSAEGFNWVYSNVKRDLLLGSVSGGTDICSLFVGSCPLLPVRAGEIQCRCLGVDISSLDDSGKELVGSMGEMVIHEPMPSMPIYFWKDKEHKRYKESYFEMYPNKWRHGDWLKVTESGSCVIYGRSDSTIKKSGVRMGTSEIYKCVESLPEIFDSLVVDFEGLNHGSYMALFVVPHNGHGLTDELKKKINESIRRNVSPKLVPDNIFEIKEVPKTLNGKKLEVPVKKLLMGVPYEKAVNRGSVSNVAALDFFTRFKIET